MKSGRLENILVEVKQGEVQFKLDKDDLFMKLKEAKDNGALKFVLKFLTTGKRSFRAC